MRNIEQVICEKLKEIEKKENVRVLYAVESGSRAWGVSSPDSDFDVRFVYVRKHDDYLRLEKIRDIIEWQLDDVLDINGWDLKKVLQHFHSGNTTLFEWCNSPIVYLTTREWEQVYETGIKYFSEKAAIYHYYGTAKNACEKSLMKENVKYKRYIYALRPILACRYIEQKHEVPPVSFYELMDKHLPMELREPVERMLDIKSKSGEKELHPQIPEIIRFIKSELRRIHEVEKGKNEGLRDDWDELNEVFKRVICQCED